jgi:hypothetical protein
MENSRNTEPNKAEKEHSDLNLIGSIFEIIF